MIHNYSLRSAGIRSKQRSCSSVTQKPKQTVQCTHPRTGALTVVRNAGILQRRTGMLVIASASFNEIQYRSQPENKRTETCSSQCGEFTTPRQWVLEQRGVGRQGGRRSRRRRPVCLESSNLVTDICYFSILQHQVKAHQQRKWRCAEHVAAHARDHTPQGRWYEIWAWTW